jgi:hypothetical protein
MPPVSIHQSSAHAVAVAYPGIQYRDAADEHRACDQEQGVEPQCLVHENYDTRIFPKNQDNVVLSTRMKQQIKRGRGSPRGPLMPCGWRCGAMLSTGDVREHMANCPNRQQQKAATNGAGGRGNGNKA